MNKLFQDSNYLSALNAINLRYLLNAYFTLKPGTLQTDIAQRLNVGQMTVSRMLTKN